MCGIALIVSGIRIDLSSLLPDFITSAPEVEQPLFHVDDIEAALRRRGPDSLGSKKVFLHPKISSFVEGQDILSLVNGEEVTKRDLQYCNKTCDCISSASGEPCELDNGFGIPKSVSELYFIGATLQLRGINPIIQPLVDTSGNILIYNGEIFGGIHVSGDSNDAEILMENLGKCCSCRSHEHTRTCYCSGNGQISVPELLSTIKGPWALIYWQDSSRTIWFGRDALGRRSLLVHWPSQEDSRLLLSSVSPPSFINTSSDVGDESGMSELNFWEELSCGVYSMSMGASEMDGCLVGEIRKHEWSNLMLQELIKWERNSVEPEPEELYISRAKIPNGQHDMLSVRSIGPPQASVLLPSQRVLVALRESVMRRTAVNTIFGSEID